MNPDRPDDEHDPDAADRGERPDDPNSAADIPTGRIRRFWKMGRLGSSVSSSYLGQRIRGVFQDPEARDRALLRTHLRNAARMAETMGHLKGAVMKVGQMLSLGDEELLPPEAAEILRVLQSGAPYLPFPRIRARVEQELDGSLDELFAEFGPEPMAAASLGQVHAGVLHDGTPVAVKVQYPDIDRTIHSDLANVQSMLSASGVFGKLDMSPYFRELEAMLVLELDYVQEAANLEQMRGLFAGHDALVLPRYVPERSSERVLTMERIDGVGLDEFLEQEPTVDVRQRAAWAVADVVLQGFLRHRVLHADPQAGNFLFQRDGRVALLDFGCVKRFEEPFVADYRRGILATQNHDREAAVDAFVDVGYIRPDAGPRMRRTLWEFIEIYMRPIARDRVYRFGQDSLVELGKQTAMARPEVIGMRPPGEVVYLHRTLVGAYFNLARLGAEGNFYRPVREACVEALG